MFFIEKIRTSPWLSLVFRISLGIIFIYAAMDKIRDPAGFSFAIQNYRLIPPSITNISGLFLSWLELYCGIFLIFGLFSGGSVVLLTGLNSIFTFAVASALLRGLDIDCGCYGSGAAVDLSKLIENLLLLAMSLHLLWYPSQLFTLDGLFIKKKDHSKA